MCSPLPSPPPFPPPPPLVNNIIVKEKFHFKSSFCLTWNSIVLLFLFVLPEWQGCASSRRRWRNRTTEFQKVSSHWSPICFLTTYDTWVSCVFYGEWKSFWKYILNLVYCSQLYADLYFSFFLFMSSFILFSSFCMLSYQYVFMMVLCGIVQDTQ